MYEFYKRALLLPNIYINGSQPLGYLGTSCGKSWNLETDQMQPGRQPDKQLMHMCILQGASPDHGVIPFHGDNSCTGVHNPLGCLLLKLPKSDHLGESVRLCGPLFRILWITCVPWAICWETLIYMNDNCPKIWISLGYSLFHLILKEQGRAELVSGISNRLDQNLH